MEVQEFSYDVLSTAVDFIYGIDIPEDFDDAEDLESLLHVETFTSWRTSRMLLAPALPRI